MPQAVAVAGIGAAGSIAGGLLGKSAADNAADQQRQANQAALGLQREQLAAQKQQQDYANQQAYAQRARNITMSNAFLRSLGATGMQDPNVNYNAILSAAPPSLSGASGVASAINAVRNGQQPNSLASLVGPTSAPGPQYSTGYAPSLGTLFGQPNPVRMS